MSHFQTISYSLVPIQDIKSSLVYNWHQLPGAMPHAFLIDLVCQKLTEAAAIVKEQGVEIVVLDAYRTYETQKAIFDKQYKILQEKHQDFSAEKLREMTLDFVSDPAGCFPHGTGGAVDLTLFHKNKPVWMGTDYDAFIKEASPYWYDKNPPTTQNDKEAAYYRNILINAMLNSGFSVNPNEYWHFEYGTMNWAIETGNKAFLTKIQDKPLVEGPFTVKRTMPQPLPFLEIGVAPVFPSSEWRADSLQHRKEGHYYCRSSHATSDGLGKLLLSCINAEKIGFTSTGRSACVQSIIALATQGCNLIYDTFIYYEVEESIKFYSKQYNWNLIPIDMTDLKSVQAALATAENALIYLDNPRNWYLDTLNIKEICRLAKNTGATTIVDISIQPLQNALLNGADVVVFSLSKYPSNGYEAGGAFAGNANLVDKITKTVSYSGDILSSSAALIIWMQAITLKDRISCLSNKTSEIASFLNNHPSILSVRTPNPDQLNGCMGGLLSFHVSDFKYGVLMEKAITNNGLMYEFPLKLACTFGSSITTFEHFASNARFRSRNRIYTTNESKIPRNIIRLGIGNDDVSHICKSLEFIINSVDYHLRSI